VSWSQACVRYANATRATVHSRGVRYPESVKEGGMTKPRKSQCLQSVPVLVTVNMCHISYSILPCRRYTVYYSIFQYFYFYLLLAGCWYSNSWLLLSRQYLFVLLNHCSFNASKLSYDTPLQRISGFIASKMNGLAILLWSLLLFSVCATGKTLASSITATASHDKNAKYQESSSSSGILSTVAGYQIIRGGSEEDGVPATSKKLFGPKGLTVEKEGNFFIAASGDSKVYKVTASSGMITTVAGTGVAGYSGNGVQATTAMLKAHNAVALDTSGNILIADTGNNRIGKVTVSTGLI
jgi:hypothetical protein